MTTYETTARWGALKLAEEMDIQSDLGPENEAEYVRNFLLEKWIRVFGPAFINGADEITTLAIAPIECSSGPSANESESEGGALPS